MLNPSQAYGLGWIFVGLGGSALKVGGTRGEKSVRTARASATSCGG